MLFQEELVAWYKKNKRDLPWRSTRDPYVIWLSEIILQQTRVQQGLPYFNKFLEAFPTVTHFAAATEEEVLKLWQGLGYYSRGRNMLHTARQVVAEQEGKFPSGYDELLKLKGIGSYTASAIASFSTGELKAVLDGNVFRLLARYFGVDLPIDTPEGKKAFGKLAQELIMGHNAAVYNQAVMEFGALVCKPVPLCNICPVSPGCYALKHGRINSLPLKLKKTKRRTRRFHYFLCTKDREVLVQLRKPGDIWQGLYELPLIEVVDPQGPEREHAKIHAGNLFGNGAAFTLLAQKKHLLTHQTILIKFFAAENFSINFNEHSSWKFVNRKELEKLPFPVAIHDFLENHFS